MAFYLKNVSDGSPDSRVPRPVLRLRQIAVGIALFAGSMYIGLSTYYFLEGEISLSKAISNVAITLVVALLVINVVAKSKDEVT